MRNISIRIPSDKYIVNKLPIIGNLFVISSRISMRKTDNTE